MPSSAPSRPIRRPAAGGRVPPRRPARHRGRRPASRRRLGTRTRIVLFAALGLAALVAWGTLSRALAPKGNTTAGRLDALIVLGSPSDSEGNPTPDELAKVTEAAREYDRGVASHVILTGGAAHNQYVEAAVMARVAESQGIPASEIFLEPRALDTIQNACYSARIMRDHGWRSAEVISVGYHLPRAALIFSRLPVDWRVHAAPPLEPGSTNEGDVLEILKTVRYLVYAQWAESCSL